MLLVIPNQLIILPNFLIKMYSDTLKPQKTVISD